MDVYFTSRSLLKTCMKKKKRAKKFGHQRARELKVALDELAAATNLEEIEMLPHRRLHPLKGAQAGAYSVDIDRQYRIWFRIPDIDEIRDEDGYVDFSEVTSIEIYFVGDPHD